VTPDSYFVCATPRTGSSLLCGLLDSTGVAGHPEAYFRPPDRSMWAARWGLPSGSSRLDFVQAARAAGSTPNGVFGAKLMWDALEQLVGEFDDEVGWAAFGRVAFVYLRRTDAVAQAVSRVRAEQTGVWSDGAGSSAGSSAVLSFDAGAITAYLAEVEAENVAWESWFATNGVEPFRVRYEDLDADNVGVTAEVLEFLGLRAAHPIVPRHRRQADALNREWIERYRFRR
jgi:LPS sulfotransferase NodH